MGYNLTGYLYQHYIDDVPGFRGLRRGMSGVDRWVCEGMFYPPEFPRRHELRTGSLARPIKVYSKLQGPAVKGAALFRRLDALNIMGSISSSVSRKTVLRGWLIPLLLLQSGKSAGGAFITIAFKVGRA